PHCNFPSFPTRRSSDLNVDGSWDVSHVQGLAAPSLSSKGTIPPSLPSLIIRPLHQVGNVVSLRQFSNNAFNHHHGMQAEERFGLDRKSTRLNSSHLGIS